MDSQLTGYGLFNNVNSFPISSRHNTASKMNMFGVSKSGGSNLFPGPLKNADAASAVTTTSSGRSLSAAATQEYSCEFGSSKYYALCGLGGILSCGITHTAVTPLDLVKCRLQVQHHGTRPNMGPT